MTDSELRSFAVSSAIAHLGASLPIVFAVYVVTVVVYLALQAFFAGRSRRPAHHPAPERTPSVDVVVPCYNEDPATLTACLDSIAAQDFTGTLTVYVADDGSPNRAVLEDVYADVARRHGFRVIRLPENQGKRYAQVEAITRSDGDIVISVDSDTLLAPDAVRQIVAVLNDPRVGAVMGEIGAANVSTNMLTRLLDRRYWYASNQVSAAESHFGAVLCCCGPFSAYRRTVLEAVLDDYLDQTFMGRRTTHGEDRYLTNLVLKRGMRTAFAAGAKASTVVPDRMRPFLRQQLRWNRTNYRDTIGILRRLPSFGPYVMVDAVVHIVAPPLLALTLVLLAAHVIDAGVGADLAVYAAGYALVGLAYSGYGVWRDRSLEALRMTWYGLLHIAVLLPSRVHALCTLTDDRWGKRGASLHIAAPARTAVAEPVPDPARVAA
jgi:N-acetylglucosaminyltransferase